MKKIVILFALSLFAVVSSKAQSGYEIDGDSDWMQRIYMGGAMGLSFGSDNTYVNLSPIVGYRITNELSGGVGVSYIYQKVFGQSFNHYGGNVFARYTIYEPVFAMAQYEFMSLDRGNGIDGSDLGRFGYSAVLIGGGVMQPLGGNAILAFTALYNVSYDVTEPSPYASPWVIGGGVTVGF